MSECKKKALEEVKFSDRHKKICTWEGCPRIAKHQQPGSLISLCDFHNNELNGAIKCLFKPIMNT